MLTTWLRALWTGALAIVLTAVTGGIWTALLVANLKSSPAIPWSAAAMAAIGYGLWRWLGGRGWPSRTREARRALLRAEPLQAGAFFTMLFAGILGLVALAGLWIVLMETVHMPGNRLPDFRAYPVWTVAAVLITAAAVGAVFEEAGFRGYFQGTLERVLPGWTAILVTALLMAPEHAVTQGFVWPAMLFYLLVDLMLGTSARLAKSILPGTAIHALGLLMFFAVIWPNDATRPFVPRDGAGIWFWIHVAQAVLFGTACIAAFARFGRTRSLA